MKFRLRTLFLLFTVIAVVIGLWVARQRRVQRIAQRRLSFMELEEKVKRLDEPLIEMVCDLPEVRSALEKSNPIDPKAAIGQSITGQGLFFGQYQFRREIELSWQTDQGDWVSGVCVQLQSMLDEESVEPHVIQLQYENSKLNHQAADWIQQQLKHPENVRFDVIRGSPK